MCARFYGDQLVATLSQRKYSLTQAQASVMEREMAISRVSAIFSDLSIKLSKLTDATRETSKESSRNLIAMVDRLGCHAQMRMQTSPRAERRRASALMRALVNGREAQAEAQALKTALESKRKTHQRIVEDIRSQVAQERGLLERTRQRQEREVAQRLEESELIIKTEIGETLDRERQLRAEIELNKSQRRANQRENINREKELCIMRLHTRRKA